MYSERIRMDVLSEVALNPPAAVDRRCACKSHQQPQRRRRKRFGQFAVQTEQLEDRITLSSNSWQLDIGDFGDETNQTTADIASVRESAESQYNDEDAEHALERREDGERESDDDREREDDREYEDDRERADDREREDSSLNAQVKDSADRSDDTDWYASTQPVAGFDYEFGSESDDLSDHLLDLPFYDQATVVEPPILDSTPMVTPIVVVSSPDLSSYRNVVDDQREMDLRGSDQSELDDSDDDSSSVWANVSHDELDDIVSGKSNESGSAKSDAGGSAERNSGDAASPIEASSGRTSPIQTSSGDEETDESDGPSAASEPASSEEGSANDSTQPTAEASEKGAANEKGAADPSEVMSRDAATPTAEAGDQDDTISGTDQATDPPVVTGASGAATSKDSRSQRNAAGKEAAPEARTDEGGLPDSPDGTAVGQDDDATAQTTPDTAASIDRLFSEFAAREFSTLLHRLELSYGLGMTASEDEAPADATSSGDTLASLAGMSRPLAAALAFGSLTGSFVYRYRQVPIAARLIDRFRRLARCCRRFVSRW